MANVETEKVVTEDKPKRGRPAGPQRDPNGKQLSAFFDGKESAHIREARFVKRFDKDSDLIHAAVLAYIADVPEPSEA